jgi:transposase
MRGQENPQASMFSYVSLEQRVPKDHPLRTLRALVDGILANTSALFDQRYSHTGRPSIPPEQLLRALLVQILFTTRSERLLDTDIARPFFRRVLHLAQGQGFVSDERFSVDGTMIEAWASHKSFVPKDGSGPDKPAGATPRRISRVRSAATPRTTAQPTRRRGCTRKANSPKRSCAT